MNIRQSTTKSLASIAIALTTLMLTACGGGDDAATTDAATSSGTGTPTTPSTAASLYGGTYTGNVSKSVGSFFGTNTYSGPMSVTIVRDVTGNYTVSGNWNVTRSDAFNSPISSTSDILTGTVSSAGAFSATGNINVRSMSGTVDAATGKITGTYTYAGAAGDFTGDFSATK